MIDEKKIEETAIEHSADNWVSDDCRTAFEDGFKNGINWFLDNLWHDASEEPEPNKWLLTERRVVNTLIHEVHVTIPMSLTWDYLKNHYTVMTRWLYIEDLMKGEKILKNR